MSIRLACVTALLAVVSMLFVAGASAAPSLQRCGGLSPVQCGSGTFCQYKVGVCGAGDQTGLCTKIPAKCPKNIRPVCGCDGKTYDNDCLRQMAGVSKKSNGKCKTPY